MKTDIIKCLLPIVFVIVLACGCKDKRQRAIELNDKGVELMMTLVPDTLEMALELLDKAIATDSTLITPYFNKANCLINLNRKMEAIRTYERYLHITDNV